MKPDFERIKKSTDIIRVVESYGIALKQEGKDFVGLCPFHEDKAPSLRVTPGKGLFRCPACNAAGNVIQFVARKENLTDREAALKLCASIPGVQRGSDLPMAGEKAAQPCSSSSAVEVDAATRARLLARVAGFYAKTLQRDRAGLDYLKSRRLDDPAMLETFQVGYCNGTLRNALPKAGEIIGQLQAIGILNEKGNECFYGRVIVPILDATGNVVSLYGRRLSDEQPRHLYLKGEHRGVFNGIAAKTSQSLFITEAVFDAMSLWAAGFRNVISLYGKDGWTADHETLIRENGTTEIVLGLDGDKRGQEAAEALEIKLSGHVKAVHRIAWPDGVKDANAFFLSRTAEEFRNLLPQLSEAAPQETAGKEEITITPEGFALSVAGRRYELCAIEKPSAARLKATVKALADEGGRFHIDTVDFYLSRSRKGFIAEAARLFREMPEAIEADVNRITVALEKYITQKLEGKTASSVTLVPDGDRLEALRMARSSGLVDELQRDFGKLGIIGEETNRLLLYLAMTSRKMDDPLAVQILSSSGAGKSHLQDAVLSLCPEEDLIKLTSLTGQALFYKGEDSLRHKCLAIAEVAGAEGARYALRNLISERKLVIESTIKNALTGRLETQLNTVYGPTAVFETTTNPDTDPETKSRYVLLSVDESPEQTKAILEAQRQSHTLEGRKRRKAREAVLAKHHALQRLLEPVAVVNPFEPLLSYGDDRLAFRRDHPKYLNLILAVTFLHQMQRPRKHDAELGDYIETSLDDIAIANELAHQLFGQSQDDLSFPSRQLLRLVGDYVSHRAAEEKKQPGAVEFTRRELREAIKWTEARLRLHLGELMRLEYVGAVSGRFGQRFCHRLLVDPDEADMGGRFVPGLKPVEQLGKDAQSVGRNGPFVPNLASVLPNLASQKGNLATTSQVESCEVEKPADADQHRANGHHVPNLAGQNGRRIYILRNEAAHIRINGEVSA
ncbi:MAG: CHC2 zinc finger domain-containing protein [Verrucomicrobiota bacterium]